MQMALAIYVYVLYSFKIVKSRLQCIQTKQKNRQVRFEMRTQGPTALEAGIYLSSQHEIQQT